MCYNYNMTNGDRFINAYNIIDHSLRVQYNFRTNISFTDLIRRCSALNTVVRVYEEDLIDLARLRNAIVHHKSNQVVAEPHDEIVALLEKIARLVSTPPLAIEVIRSGDVAIVKSSISLKELILETSKVGYSSIPIYKQDNLIGVIRWRKFVEVLGGHIITQNKSIDDFVSNTTAEEFLRQFPSNNHYMVASNKITIEEVLSLFNHNRKLACIIVTRDGTASCKPLGIITGGDIMDLMKVIENY